MFLITATVTNQCTVTEGNFEIDVTLVTAGIAPYSFSIDGGAFQTSTAPFTISSLSSGSHSVEVRESNFSQSHEKLFVDNEQVDVIYQDYKKGNKW